MAGWILLNKPMGLSSTTASSRVRRLLKAAKAGHVGTLDPLATGLLPVALNQGTKCIPWFDDGLKVYTFSVGWGTETTTGDAEGAVTFLSAQRPTEAAIQEALPAFTGILKQIPPLYSAIKINGSPSYARVRRGEFFEIPPRSVTIHDFTLTAFHPDEASFRVSCSKGTYIRSLARDLARHLGTYGHARNLHRVQVGHFHIQDAISLDYLENVGHIPPGSCFLKSIMDVLVDIPALSICENQKQKLLHGQAISFSEQEEKGFFSRRGGACLAVFVCQNAAIALVEKKQDLWHPVRVFEPIK